MRKIRKRKATNTAVELTIAYFSTSESTTGVFIVVIAVERF